MQLTNFPSVEIEKYGVNGSCSSSGDSSSGSDSSSSDSGSGTCSGNSYNDQDVNPTSKEGVVHERLLRYELGVLI
ncbi:hypothetical protein L1987_05632 [Smallanthus sonchifolius]|uniref:Uncharacterized protein n=1 Tax=Smallanthus sonchifolius TaxID=185202 RepID=A0ACB9JVZ3_9ASTR|nr:hypothetical protein L1987_05632 [Smallanthus sonchifolius]